MSLALLGAGPSLRTCVEFLGGKTLVASNHAHDFLVEHDRPPHYTILTEAMHKKHIAPVPGCTYYVRNDAGVRPTSGVIEYPCEWITGHFPMLEVAQHLWPDADLDLYGFDASAEGDTHCDGNHDYGDKRVELEFDGRVFMTNTRWLRQIDAALTLPDGRVRVHGDGLLAHAFRARPARVAACAGRWMIVRGE